ncbi:MAG: O-antigen ligase family protein [Thermoanaerobaculia bacterium]
MFELLIWLVPLAVAGVGTWRPWAGLVALAAVLPLFGAPPGGPYLGAFDATALAVIVTCWRAGRPAASPLAWPTLALLVVGLTSIVPSPYLPPSWAPGILLRLVQALPGVEGWTALYTWRAAADLLLGWGLFLSVRRAYAGRSVRPLAMGFLAGLGAAILFGFAADSGLLSLDAYRPQYSSRGPEPRVASLFFLSGWLSQYLVVATPVALSAVAGKVGRLRYLAPTVLALSLGCLALTRQRGGWLAAALQLGVGATWLGLRWRRQGRLGVNAGRSIGVALAVLAVVGIVVVVAGDFDQIVDRAASIRTGPASRLPLWRAGVEMFQERPLLGWGVGAFAPAYDVLHPPGSPGARGKRGSAHNLYLQTAAETGLLGLAALALLATAAARCVRRPRAGDERIAGALAICLVGIAAYGGVQHMFYLRAIAWAIWLLLGCLAVVTTAEAAQPPTRLARGLAILALALIPLRLAVVDPPPLAGSRTFGLHEAEGEGERRFRWTEGFAAVRLPRAGDSLTLAFANGHPLGAARPTTVTVAVHGEAAATFAVPGGWQTHTFEVPPGASRELVLTIAAQPTFRPFSDFLSIPDMPSTDIRSLGVAVKLPAGSEPAPR